MNVYEIIDEPRASRASSLAVDPLWPFLATMLGGAWLGWPWFLVNSHALGSSTKGREVVSISRVEGRTGDKGADFKLEFASRNK